MKIKLEASAVVEWVCEGCNQPQDERNFPEKLRDGVWARQATCRFCVAKLRRRQRL